MPLPDPSFTEQYEYANEHDIKCLVIITDTSQTDSVKVSLSLLELGSITKIIFLCQEQFLSEDAINGSSET